MDRRVRQELWRGGVGGGRGLARVAALFNSRKSIYWTAMEET